MRDKIATRTGFRVLACALALTITSACKLKGTASVTQDSQSADGTSSPCAGAAQQLSTDLGSVDLASAESDVSGFYDACFNGTALELDDSDAVDELVSNALSDATGEGTDTSTDASALALDAPSDRTACKQPTATDPTGCADYLASYADLEADLSQAVPDSSVAEDKRLAMIKAVSGMGKAIADIALPHCEAGFCELRARADGNSPSGQWHTGACYDTRANWMANANLNPFAFPCANGLQCDGFQKGGLLSRDTFGTCHVVDQGQYDAYFKLAPPAAAACTARADCVTAAVAIATKPPQNLSGAPRLPALPSGYTSWNGVCVSPEQYYATCKSALTDVASANAVNYTGADISTCQLQAANQTNDGFTKQLAGFSSGSEAPGCPQFASYP